MSKLNERLTLVANLSVVVGIVFLAVEMRQNTEALQAQTRDSITEKQMEFSGWIASSRDLSDVYGRGTQGRANLEPSERAMFTFLVHGIMREWENSLYQFERGLFTAEEFEAYTRRWRMNMSAHRGYREFWEGSMKETFAPSFRAEIDRIVAEVEQAQ